MGCKMFTGSNVIILGAGTSVDFGLPLGNEIFHILIDDCRHLLGAAKTEGGAQFVSTLSDPRHYAAHSVGHLVYHTAMSKLEGNDGTRPTLRMPIIDGLLNSIEDLQKALSRTTAETIDEFLTLHPSKADLALKLMASAMFKRLYESTGRAYARKEFYSRLTPNGQRNWIHLFINVFRTNFLRGKRPRDRVRIISFNYDPILRLALDELFSSIEQPIGPWDEHFDLHQVYGEFDPTPPIVEDVYGTLSAWAQNIATVGLARTGFPRNAIHNVASAISNATTAYAAGFAFARDNCEHIGLHQRDKSKLIRFVNFDNNPRFG